MATTTPRWGSATVFSTRTVPYDEFGSRTQTYRLSDDRTRVLELLLEDGYGGLGNVLDLDGHVLDSARTGDAVALDFSGAQALLSTASGSLRWRVGSEPTPLSARRASFADLGRGTLSVELGDGRSGFTRLARPRTIRWAAPFRPVRPSPDGRLVYGHRLTPGGGVTEVAQVRRVEDGRVVASFRGPRMSLSVGRYSQWEGTKALLLAREYGTGGAYVLVRCTLAGRCARASAPSTPYRVAFSFPGLS